jgi:hypothetical protein
MTSGVLVGLAYTLVYEHPLQPGMVVLLEMVVPKEPSTSSSVCPVHVALGIPALGHVEAARLVPGGTITTQSTYAPPGASVKLVHCCSVVPAGRGPGGGGCSEAGGGGDAVPPGVIATTVVPVHTPEAHFWRTTMTSGLDVGLAYVLVYEQPLQPGMVVFDAMVEPYVPSTSSCVLPVHVALGIPAVGQVDAARLLPGGTMTTQST